MRFAIICLAVTLTGCDDRSSFDRQYDETANEIQNRSARIEADLNSSNATTQEQSDNRD
jgi:hypothetical protein